MDRQRIEASAARLKGDTLPVDVMDQIRSHILLSDVIARRVTLARAGNEWKGLCPFHHETSPSFFVNDKKHFYHCFGCGAHGDVISFVSQTKKVTVSDAVKLLEASLKISK